MTPYTLPDWHKILFLILTCISFVPQVYRLARRRGDASGIRSFYIVMNLLAATELFSIVVLLIIPHPRPYGTADLRTNSDYIDFANIVIIWVLWLVIFAICVAYRWKEPRSRASHVLAFYIFWLMISVIPVVMDIIVYANAPTEPFPIRIINLGIYLGAHLLYITPAVAILALVSVAVQARETLNRSPASDTGALSIAGIALQLIVFGVLAGTRYFGQLGSDDSNPSLLQVRLARLLIAHHTFFALEQALLLVAVGWHRWRGRHGTDDLPDETQPLISH